MSDKVRIVDLVKGQKAIIQGEYTKKEKENKKIEPYLNVKISDAVGNAVYSNIWNNLEAYPLCQAIENGDYVEAEIQITEKGEYTYFDLISIKTIEKEEDKVVDIKALTKELKLIFKSIKDEKLRFLLNSVFSREDVNKAFFKAPGSQMSAYSFEGGLLAHTVRLVFLTKAVIKVFSEWKFNIDDSKVNLNEDLLVTASILHDVGKVHTLIKEKQKYVKTIQGELFEDTYVGLKIILEELAKSKLSDEQKMIIEHVIGSSKGKQTFGALFVGRQKEALAFQFIENLDVQMANFEFLNRNSGQADIFAQLFQKTIFLGGYEEE
ncbi:MAG: hypothetical protein K0R54_653 [Clostridiaceae bacterium]|jgi:3'-5' exoribonuclease|nr:hypothetical protein [Clostridiaceae bacterium]